MPRAARESPAADPQRRPLIGAAVYAHCARAFGEWCPEQLEARLAQALTTPTASSVRQSVPDLTNRCRRWLRGVVPAPQTVRALGDLCRPGFDPLGVREHPYWALLADGVNYEGVKRVFDWLPLERLRQVFRFPYPCERGQMRIRAGFDVLAAAELSEAGDWSAMTAATALLWEGRILGLVTEIEVGARVLRHLFPAVVARTPELYIRWPTLAAVCRRIFWDAADVGKKGVASADALARQVELAAKRARAEGVPLPPEGLVSYGAAFDVGGLSGEAVRAIKTTSRR